MDVHSSQSHVVADLAEFYATADECLQVFARVVAGLKVAGDRDRIVLKKDLLTSVMACRDVWKHLSPLPRLSPILASMFCEADGAVAEGLERTRNSKDQRLRKLVVIKQFHVDRISPNDERIVNTYQIDPYFHRGFSGTIDIGRDAHPHVLVPAAHEHDQTFTSQAASLNVASPEEVPERSGTKLIHGLITSPRSCEDCDAAETKCELDPGQTSQCLNCARDKNKRCSLAPRMNGRIMSIRTGGGIALQERIDLWKKRKCDGLVVGELTKEEGQRLKRTYGELRRSKSFNNLSNESVHGRASRIVKHRDAAKRKQAKITFPTQVMYVTSGATDERSTKRRKRGRDSPSTLLSAPMTSVPGYSLFYVHPSRLVTTCSVTADYYGAIYLDGNPLDKKALGSSATYKNDDGEPATVRDLNRLRALINDLKWDLKGL